MTKGKKGEKPRRLLGTVREVLQLEGRVTALVSRSAEGSNQSLGFPAAQSFGGNLEQVGSGLNGEISFSFRQVGHVGQAWTLLDSG